LETRATDRFFTKSRAIIAAALLSIFLTSGCVGMLPGGSEADNDSFYDSVKELQGWVNDLKPGMKKGEVFARLGRRQEEFERLTRSDIVGVLFGGKDAGIPTGFTPPGGENIARFLNSLEGYRMVYKKVKRKHGFTSPIRVQTDEKGYSYEISLIFKDGRLYEKPFLTGGIVNGVSSKTLFDYLNPGLIMNATGG
jgi:hypothetical protein